EKNLDVHQSIPISVEGLCGWKYDLDHWGVTFNTGGIIRTTGAGRQEKQRKQAAYGIRERKVSLLSRPLPVVSHDTNLDGLGKSFNLSRLLPSLLPRPRDPLWPRPANTKEAPP
ncbi:MAG: hypothetical protein P8Y29_08390, partial [Gemmatimonadota bacterium]